MNSKPVSKNICFNLFLYLGLFLSIATTLFIICTNDFEFCSQVVCFSNILIYFELPIKMMSASLAVSAFVALIHRSEQTGYQIEISMNQNVFKNFIDHKEYFIETMSLLEKSYPIKIESKIELYGKLFPKNNTQNVEFTSQGLGEESYLKFYIMEHESLVRKYNKIMERQVFAEWLYEYLVLTKKLGVHASELRHVSRGWEGYFAPELHVGGIPADVEKFLYYCEKVIDELFRFCFPKESRSSLITRVGNVDVSNFMREFFKLD